MLCDNCNLHTARGVDFDAVMPLTTLFIRGSLVGDTATVSITILDDQTLEGLHSFTAEVADTDQVAPGASAIITIVDNDSQCCAEGLWHLYS